MNITDVRIRKVSDEGKMKAIVSITFDDEFVVHDVKIIEGQNGLFVAMPSRKMGEGDFRDIAHPLLSETRNKIKDAIFAEYEKLLDEVVATEELLEQWIFDKQKAEVIFALEDGREVGFALFFHNFSTSSLGTTPSWLHASDAKISTLRYASNLFCSVHTLRIISREYLSIIAI